MSHEPGTEGWPTDAAVSQRAVPPRRTGPGVRIVEPTCRKRMLSGTGTASAPANGAASATASAASADVASIDGVGSAARSANGKTKRIILVRHAESTENVKATHAMSAWNRLVSLQGLPSRRELWSSVRLLECNTDSSISDLGCRQLEDQRARMQEARFLETAGIELVVHSPLQRAKETCHAVFGELLATGGGGGGGDDDGDASAACAAARSAGGGVPVLEHEDLRECRPLEHVLSAPFQARVDRFKEWLASRDEKTIALVGHGQHFKRLLQMDSKFWNVDVWAADFHTESKDFVGPPTHLFRTPLARASEAKT